MDEFMQLQWRTKEPHELDYGSDFIPDDEVCSSYIYSEFIKEDTAAATVKNKLTKKQNIFPGLQYNFKSNITSCLTKQEQSKCLIALKLLQSGKKAASFEEQTCMELYNNCLELILKENKKFLAFATKDFERLEKKVFKIKPMLQQYAETLWKYKLNSSKEYKQFYKGIDILPYSYKDDEEPIEMLHVQNILELGTLAKFLPPTLLKPYHLKCKFLPKNRTIYNSNQPVSKDTNIDKLIQTTKIDIVISSSGLTKLLDFTKRNAEWDIPVVVKQYEIRTGDGQTRLKNVVFIDKPFPSRSPSIFDFNEKCMKILLKTNFCESEAFSFQTVETPIDTHEFSKQPECKQDQPPSEVKETNEALMKAEDSGKRKLQADEVQDNKRIKPDDTDHIIKKRESRIHHNVSYRLWKLQLKNEQCELMKTKYQANSIHVLIRSKLDGCEATPNGQLQPINVVPKIEYHLKYGAAIPTKEELLKQWVYAYFRPSSQVRRIRMYYNTGEIICYENCNVQKIANEAQTHHRLNLNLGLGVLYKIFNRLIHLPPGNYLLHHLVKDGAFVKLLQETNENDDGVYNLHDTYDSNKCKINQNKLLKWHPIDVNFILPKHNLAEEMPGMFKPGLKKVLKNKKMKKMKRKNASPGKSCK